MKKSSVIVGMSGGIDSTVTAFLLKEQGYDVTGLSLQLSDEYNHEYEAHLKHIAARLDIPVYFSDAREQFRNEVIRFYTGEHLKGRTPAPCSFCNPVIKWPFLLQAAKKYNCRYVATGHYIQIRKINNRYWIFQGADEAKDQSYFLWDLPQEIIKNAITPLGALTKKEVVNIASRNGFEDLATKKESTGLCFARGLACEEALRKYVPDIDNQVGPGKVIDASGKVIGSHAGYPFYTVGQKTGLKLENNKHLCVKKIFPEKNVLMADSWENLYTGTFTVSHYTSTDVKELLESRNLRVRIRGFGLNPEGLVKLRLKSNHLQVETESKAWAPAPGQPAVFYEGDKLMGGGIINDVIYP